MNFSHSFALQWSSAVTSATLFHDPTRPHPLLGIPRRPIWNMISLKWWTTITQKKLLVARTSFRLQTRTFKIAIKHYKTNNLLIQGTFWTPIPASSEHAVVPASSEHAEIPVVPVASWQTSSPHRDDWLRGNSSEPGWTWWVPQRLDSQRMSSPSRGRKRKRKDEKG